MAGHSHWAGIRHKKAAEDKRRGKVFSKIAKMIIVAARRGGGDPATNLSLRHALDRARGANMPRDTIERAIQRGTGELEGADLQELTYEAYGPGGAGILIQALTDNVNRTSQDVRHVVEKHGGTLAKPGAVAWNFETKALFTVRGAPEERVIEVALEAGAEDVVDEGDALVVTGPPSAFQGIAEALEAAGIPCEASEVGLLPKSRVALGAEDARRVVAVIGALEDHEDVQSAITTADVPAEVLAEME